MNDDTAVLEKNMKLNVYSVVELIQLARPHLVKSKGEIVNISSIAGQPSAFSRVPYYAMAKAALDQMMRALAIELIAEGVRVNNINNAGAAFVGGATGMKENTAVLEKNMQLNVYSVVELIQLARPHLVKSQGEIVNISSIAGQPCAFARVPYYAMAKAALDQMMRALAIELIAEGVRVNNVSPGAVITRFPQNMGISDAMAEKLYGHIATNPGALPCGKVGSPLDIANVVAFLADRSLSSYIVGQTIIADGGTTLVLASNADPVVNQQLKSI
ncbi:oxidoreductase, short chain dehydrogenase/reductase family protein [Oesophagostomum dentatum]|uniref:Oxidoreductase, short chain dehydrogenase/reductase family protein n=1 Tax=Oesophagostomum dentatum TaxID=61180 RepID=A0A0B1TI61_OESDE|nr:oxidoreductase, short chain dehydrogenase/reductase family protein [Oesophagostomum dentatum]